MSDDNNQHPTDAGTDSGFPVKKILLAAAAAPLALGGTIVKKSVPGVAALVGGYLLVFGTQGTSIGTADEAVAMALGLLIPIIVLIVYGYTLIGVSMHRIFLLGPESIPGNGFVKFTSREWRFFGWGIALGLICGFVGAISAALVLSQIAFDPQTLESGMVPALSLWTFVGLMPMAYMLGRLSFVLPGTATGSRPNLGWSWVISRRYQWQTMLLVGVAPLAINMVVELIASFLPGWLLLIVSIVLGIYLAIFGIAVLSFTYRTLCELQPDLPPPPLDEVGGNG